MIIKVIRTFIGDDHIPFVNSSGTCAREDDKSFRKIGIRCKPFYISSFLIDTGNEVILVDTSFADNMKLLPEDMKFPVGVGHRIDMFKDALEKTGYTVSDIDKIVLTHFHLDHTAELQLFPHARIFICKRDFKSLKGKVPNIEPIDLTVNPFKNFVGSFKVAENVWMLPAYGHSRGHSIVVAHETDLPEMPLLSGFVPTDGFYYMFAGDLTASQAALKNGEYLPLTVSKGLSQESLDTVREFVKNNKTVYLLNHAQNLEALITEKSFMEL